MNIGNLSNLKYDECAYPDQLESSTAPVKYRLNSDNMYNCNRCLSTTGQGPRSNFGVSTYKDVGKASSQDLVDLDSVFKNLNVKTSKCKRNMINPVNPTEFKNYDNTVCNDSINPEQSRLSYPPSNYRCVTVNRFYNTINDSQKPIFWDFSVNSRLQTKDNYVSDVPVLWGESALPVEQTSYQECKNNTQPTNACPKAWNLTQ